MIFPGNIASNFLFGFFWLTIIFSCFIQAVIPILNAGGGGVGVWLIHSYFNVALPFVYTIFCMLTLSIPLAFASSNYLVIELLINYLSRVLESPSITDSSTLHVSIIPNTVTVTHLDSFR